MASARRAQASPRLVFALVALSGASGLLYELLWIRALGLHFGTSTPAVATVTATFMGGLALGNAWLGARADRSARPFSLYLRLEVAIAVTGLLVSFVLVRGGFLLDGLARLAERAGAFSLAVRWAAVVLLLLVPTVLMGGTLPVLARALVRRGRTARALGALYACNTLGAVVGALLPDLWLVASFGLSATALAAATGNMLVASAALRLAAREPALAPATGERAEAPETASERARAATAPRTAIVLSALSGFAGMALEVLWSRTLEHWTAALVTSFSVLLAVYLSALALGAALARALADRSRRPARIAGLLLALAGTSVLVTLALAPRWRDLQRALWPRPPELARMGLWHDAIDALMHALYLETAPCLLMGAAFPFVARAYVRPSATGTTSGRLLTVNTMGCVLGSLIAAFAWLPQIGQQASYFVAAVLLALAGGAAALSWRGPRLPALAAVNFAVVVALVWWFPATHLSSTYFRSGGHVEAVREGPTTTAAAAARYTYGEPYYLELLTPGVSMSDTRLGSRRYMAMLAHAGMLLAHTPERALLICYGVGNTARSLLSHPELERLHVVDIASEVLELAPRFAPAQGGNPLADPRVRVFVDDGRHHLIVHDERYDVITSEPPPPNHAGVVNLYSREFYRLARTRLRAGGVISQWLPMFQLSIDDARAMVAAFTAELPHTALLYGQNEHFILIGSDSELAIDPERVRALAALPRMRRELARSGIGGLADVYGSVVLTDPELRAFARDVRPVSDDRPSIQYPWQPLSGHSSYADRFGSNRARSLALLPRSAGGELQAAAERAASAVERVLRVVHRLPARPSIRTELELGHAIYLARRARPDDEGLLKLLGVDGELAAIAERALGRPGAAAVLAQTPAAARAAGAGPRQDALHHAALMLARRALYTGDPQQALRRLQQIESSARDRGYQDFLIASALRTLGRAAEAAALYGQAARATRAPELRATLEQLRRTASDPALAAAGPFATPNAFSASSLQPATSDMATARRPTSP